MFKRPVSLAAMVKFSLIASSAALVASCTVPRGGSPAGNSAQPGGQSPIDIKTSTIRAGSHSIEYYCGMTHENVLHKEHTVEVEYDDGSQIEFDGTTYDFKQLHHFHTPSEHLIDGGQFPLEAHLVHTTAEGGLLVMGALFREGRENSFLAQFLADVPEEVGRFESQKLLDVAELFPDELHFYTYRGSLTTAPFTGGVQWLILKELLEALPAQMEILRRLQGNNARPQQPLRGRKIDEI
jgi:carbonic anhydrase